MYAQGKWGIFSRVISAAVSAAVPLLLAKSGGAPLWLAAGLLLPPKHPLGRFSMLAGLLLSV